MLVVIEGVDGCGKSTQVRRLTKYFAPMALGIAFPDRSTASGKVIDGLLRKVAKLSCSDSSLGSPDVLSAVTLQSLMAANMRESEGLYRAAAYPLAFCDRYTQSAEVYGCMLDHVPRVFVRRLHEGLPKPRLSILLDVNAETVLARKERDTAELYEGDVDKVNLLINGYRKLWEYSGPDYVIVDATVSPAAITDSILAILRKLVATSEGANCGS